MLTFIDDFRKFPYLDECLERGAYVPCTELGKPIAIRLKGPRGTTRWIVSVGSWGVDLSQKWLRNNLDFPEARAMSHDELLQGWLIRQRELYAYLKVGTQPTSGAGGQALLRKTWKDQYGDDWKSHRHQRPPGIACKEIQETRTGARSDTFEEMKSFETAWEIDRKNAYGAEARLLPTGLTYRILPGGPEQVQPYATYRVRCTVTIRDPLVYGPFPIRKTTEFGESLPDYPTRPGTYETWLWKEEIEKTRAKGCEVVTHEGWGWYEWTDDMVPFVEMMSQLRDQAPNKYIAMQVKRCITAAFGRFGMPSGMYVLVPEEEASEDDLPLCIGGDAYDWFVQWRPDPAPTSMPHWYDYIIMKCRLNLYEETEKHIYSEMVIATNTDAILLKPGADVSMYRDKGPAIENGEYGKRILEEVIVPAPRHLESKQKWTTPGVPEHKRKRRYRRNE